MKKSVVVTGASSGIGRACVLQMSRAGWRVFATVRKARDRESLQSEGIVDLVPIMLDVEDRQSIAAAAEEVTAQLAGAGLDGLVNVAGIGTVRPVEYIRPEDLQKNFDVNLFGQIAVTQAFLPLLRKQRGRIVNISSVGAHIAIPFGGLLNASKSAFGLMTDALRLELRPFAVRVSTVEPGSIATPAVDKTLGDIEGVIASLPEEGQRRYRAMLRSFAVRAYARESKGSPPEVVALAVHHALAASRPRIRYRVGKDARLLAALARFLPDSLLDSARLRMLGLPTQFGAGVPEAAKKPVSAASPPARPLARSSHRGT
jgi:NAD(P)-dependent dehydrogenase (short-subunit alcohol dehydrogenase family)